MVWFMAFSATFNNILVISWRWVLLVEGTGVPGENHRPVASHWQTLSHNVVSSTPRHEQGFELTTLVMIGTDCTGSCKFNYHTITTTKASVRLEYSETCLYWYWIRNDCIINYLIQLYVLFWTKLLVSIVIGLDRLVTLVTH